MQREHLENKKEFLEFKNRILEIKKELEYNMQKIFQKLQQEVTANMRIRDIGFVRLEVVSN